MAPKHVAFWSSFAAVVLLDQATKIAVVRTIELGRGEVVLIPGLLSIVHAQNPGAAFGLFEDLSWRYWLFGFFTVAICAVMADLFRRLAPGDRWMSLSLGLLMGGAVGNAIDRVHKGTVTDFVKVWTNHPTLSPWLRANFGTDEWPTFNIADSALLVGVFVFLIAMLREDGEEVPDERPPDEEVG